MGHDAFGVLFAGDIGGFASMYSITSRTLPAVGAASLSRPRPVQGGLLWVQVPRAAGVGTVAR